MGQPIYGSNDTEGVLQQPEQSAHRSSAEASALLGSRLLQGWRMLAECCPECAVPLMQPRDTDLSFCASCDGRYPVDRTEGQQPSLQARGAGLRVHPLPPEILSHPLHDTNSATTARGQTQSSGPPTARSHDAEANAPPYPSIAADAQGAQPSEPRNYLEEFRQLADHGFTLPDRPPPVRGGAPAMNRGFSASNAQQQREGLAMNMAISMSAAEPALEPADSLAFQQREAEFAARRRAELEGLAGEQSLSEGIQREAPAAPPPSSNTSPPATPHSQGVTPQETSSMPSQDPAAEHMLATGSGSADAGTSQIVGADVLHTAEAGRSSVARVDASQAVAEKLLQGWTLLEQHCPRCLTPLVADRERRMFCAGCNLWAVPAAQLSRGALPPPWSIHEGPAPSQPTREEPLQTEMPREEGPIRAEASPRTSSQQRPLASSPASSKKLPSPGGPPREVEPRKSPRAGPASSPSGWPNAQPVVAVVAQTILDKMLEINELLQQTPAREVEECARLLAVVNDCSNALKGLQQL